MSTDRNTPVRDPSQYVIATVGTYTRTHILVVSRDMISIFAESPHVLFSVTKMGATFTSSGVAATSEDIGTRDIADTIAELLCIVRDYMTWGKDPSTHRTLPMRAW